MVGYRNRKLEWLLLRFILSGIPMVGYRNNVYGDYYARGILSGIPMVGYRNLKCTATYRLNFILSMGLSAKIKLSLRIF